MYPYKKSSMRLAWALVIAVQTAPTQAYQTSSQNDKLDSETLVQMALARNPDVESVISRIDAYRHQVEVSDTLDDPKVSFGVAPAVLGSSGGGNGVLVEFQQALPWPGVLDLRRKAALTDVRLWQQNLALSKIVLAREARALHASWLYRKELLELNSHHQSVWNDFIKISESKYAGGTGAKSPVLQARQELEMLRQERIELEASLQRDVASINRLLANDPDTDIALQPLSHVIDVTRPMYGAALANVDMQPGYRLIAAQVERKAREFDLARRDRYPSFSVMTKYNGIWNNPDQRWSVGVGVNLPLDFGKRTGRENRIRAEKRSLEWKQQDTALILQERLAHAYSAWNEAQKKRALYQQDLIPLAEESLATAVDEYRSGAGNFLSLLVAERQLLNTQRLNLKAEWSQRVQFANLTASAGLIQVRDWHELASQRPLLPQGN